MSHDLLVQMAYCMPCIVILIPKHSFCNTVCVCMVMQIKLVVGCFFGGNDVDWEETILG